MIFINVIYILEKIFLLFNLVEKLVCFIRIFFEKAFYKILYILKYIIIFYLERNFGLL